MLAGKGIKKLVFRIEARPLWCVCVNGRVRLHVLLCLKLCGFNWDI